MKFFLVFTLIISFSEIAYSQEKFRIHSCEKKEKCIDPKSAVLSFKVDSNNDKVLMRLHEGGAITSTSIFDKEDCKVFDRENWICKPMIENLPLYEYRMENGILSYERFTDAIGTRKEKKRFFWTEKL